MGPVLSIFLLLFLSLSTATVSRQISEAPAQPISGPPDNGLIRGACKASRDQQACESSLTHSTGGPPAKTLLDTIKLAIWVSQKNFKTAEPMVSDILKTSGKDLNRTNAAKICQEVLHLSDHRTTLATDAFTGGKIKDARSWLSAAQVYQYDCWSALKYVNGTAKVGETMAFLNASLGLTSNALGMLLNYDNFGEKTETWGPPKTERDGFWERVDGSGPGPNGGVPAGLKPDVTVCKGGGCKYATLQAAVDAAPANLAAGLRFVIFIKAGVYDETVRVPLEKKNLVFLGDGMGKTVITGSRNVGQPGLTTYMTATVDVFGDGFMASGLTIKNTAGPDAHQAVAFKSDSDLSVIQNCEFLGNQDTVYAHTLRQYYKSCRIEGNVDFIFGNSASYFEDCIILVTPRQVTPEAGETNTVTAHGRIDPAQSTGFVFSACVINGTREYMTLYHSKPTVHKNYLGRPWKEYSRTVFIKSTLEALISPEGWSPWIGDSGLKTLYYGEFENVGSGSKISTRVPWSNQIPAKFVSTYSLQNFIQGNQWIPHTSP